MRAAIRSQKQARFTAYEFNLDTGELSRSGLRMRLEIQPAKVLRLLIEAGGNLVSRAVLISALWPGEIEGNFDRRLDKAVAKLRASLNDDPAKPLYIETVKGRGYCFLPEVTIEDPNPDKEADPLAMKYPISAEPMVRQSLDDTQQTSLPNTLLARGTLRKPHPAQLVWGAITLVIIALLAWSLPRRSLARTTGHSRPVVLLLGFRETSNHSENKAWISHAVTEWISADLNTGGELQLVQAGERTELQSPAADSGCSGSPENVLETARRTFGADMVVYGVYSAAEDGASGDRWRLDVCLESTRDHKGLESMTVVGAKGDIAQLVSNAGEVLRSKLGLKQLSSQSLGYLRATLPSNPAAARLYIEGTSSLNHFEPQEAVALLTQAEQLDPRHSPTHAALSAAWATLGYLQRSLQEAMLARQLAKELSPAQQLEYEGLADEARNDWTAAIAVYTSLLQRYPDSIDYGLKLANSQTRDAKAQLALETVNNLRSRNPGALIDPRVDMVEAAADSALSDFRGQLAAATKAEKHADEQGSGLLVAKARMERGNAEDFLGEWTEALKQWRSAGQTFESIGDRGGMADALNHQADLAWKKDDTVNATELFEKSIHLSNAIGDNVDAAYSLSRLGTVRMSVERAPGGEMLMAVKMFRQAALIYHTIGNTAEEGYVLSLLGDEAMQRSQYEEARTFYVKAMVLSQAAGDKSRIAGRMLDLGIVDETEGHIRKAIAYFQQSSRAYDELGQRDRAAIARIRLGGTLFRAGKLEDAEPILEASLTAMRSFGRTNQVREVTGDLTKLETLRNPIRAEILAREGIRLEEETNRKNACAPWYSQLAEIELALGKLQNAKEAIREAFLPGEKLLSVELLPTMLAQRGDVRMADKDYVGANSDFSRSLLMSRKRGDKFIELGTRLGLAELQIREKGLAEKSDLDRLKRDADQLGYGVFDIKIDAFLRSLSPTQLRD